MTNDSSDHPLLKGNVITITDLDNYVELLSITTDPTRTLYIGHIKITINDTTSAPLINVFLDGKQYLKDYRLLEASIAFDFGRHIKLNRVSKPILVEIKKTAAGAGALIATAFVDGVEQY